MTSFVAKSALTAFGTGPVSIQPYCAPDFFAREVETIFRRVWLCVGREIDLPEPGDFLVKDIPVCDASVVVARGKDNRLRAFHNVCSHRGARVVLEPRGHKSRFTCPYHGWSYNTAGALRAVPDETSFFDLDKQNCGLTRIELDTASGFIFINLDPQPQRSLQTYLGGIAERLEQHPLDNWPCSYQFGAEIPANWKCIIDNFQETYHLNFTHALSLHDRSSGPGNPMGHPLSFEFFGPHRMMGIWGNPAHKQALVEGIAARNGSLISQGAADEKRDDLARHPNWQMDVHVLFPNMLIDISPGLFLTHEIMPLAVDRSWWQTTAYFSPAKDAGERISQEYSAAALRDTAVEDYELLTTMQSGMKSGAKSTIQFQANEILCRHLYEMVNSYVEGRPVWPDMQVGERA